MGWGGDGVIWDGGGQGVGGGREWVSSVGRWGGVAVRAPVLWKYQAMVSLRFLIHDVRLQGEEAPVATETARIYFQGGWQEAGVFRLADLGAGAGMR